MIYFDDNKMIKINLIFFFLQKNIKFDEINK